MRELSLRQDPDLRKELALLARGCDFVLPSRFKKRLRAFQQGQAGVCMSVPSATLYYAGFTGLSAKGAGLLMLAGICGLRVVVFGLCYSGITVKLQ